MSDLLGGAVRDAVPFSAYLFYKWAAHPGAEPDSWGEALDPDGIVAQARRMVDEYGFSAIKLKGGVFPPEEEVAAIEALRAEFGDHPLRLDPNAAWTPETSLKVAARLAGVLEYLEDPTPGLDGMAEVARPGADAAGHQHVRGGVRSTGTRGRQELGVAWCSPTTTTGAGCSGPGCWQASATRSAWDCPCTPTPTWGSAWPRWCTWPRPHRISPTRATPTGRGRPRMSSGPVRSNSARGSVPVPTGPGLGSADRRRRAGRPPRAVPSLRPHAIATTPATCAAIDPSFEAVSPRW